MSDMIPIGYMAKRIAVRPDWLKNTKVLDIYSVSNCMSADFADYINYWKHNGFWLFNSPALIRQVACANGCDLIGTSLFFYEVYQLEYDDTAKQWRSFGPEASFTTQVTLPVVKALEGFDVASFWQNNVPEHSPLSCNGLADEIEVNNHCLLPSFERARKLLENGQFLHSEPGPYRIIAVYSVHESSW